MAKALGSVNVETGMLVVIDPVYLFTEQEWDEVNSLADRYGGDIPRAVVESLARKIGNHGLKTTAFFTEHGDGLYKVVKKADGVTIVGV